ncbi:MAG: RNA polymerase factor sigma-54, partial [Verrucomicrobia bacterium]|nr:RNA polymerase factor sigma-54 [Verrucomicrobiota bacterium]
KLLQIDKDYGNLSEQGGSRRVTEEDEERRQFMFDSITTTTTLHDNLMEQVRTSDLSPEILAAAELVVGNIDDYGYLKATPEELAQNHQIPLEVVQKAIQTIQTFQPAGVGAADLRECLLLQLERAGRKDSLEYRIVDQQMEALGKRRMPEMAKALDCSIDEIQDAVQLIGKLDPRPGRAYLPDNDQFVVPDVFVTKVNGEYVVTSNNDHIPQIRISNHYKDIMSRAQTDNEARDYIRDKIKAGKFFINSLHQRQRTILNIAREIVRRQRGFMEHGISALVPMTMVQVAESVDPQVHETTVSRAVSSKYIQTPQGMFEMKFFFTSGIATSTGGEMSNTSVKDIISEIFSNENPAKPLSDAEVVKMLEAREIMIARRTVAKYRDELNILPSNLRKVY